MRGQGVRSRARRAWAAGALAVGGLLCAAVGPVRADAHPFDIDLYGQQLTVSVGAAAIEVQIVAEVPTRVVLADAKAQHGQGQRPSAAQRAAFTERWLQELRDGYRLYIDGERVPLESLPVDGQNGVGDAKFIHYRLHLRAALTPGAAHQINLIDDNFPDERAVRAVSLRAKRDWRLDAASLIDWGADGALIDRSGAWSALNADRELRLSVQPRQAWRAALGGLGHRLGAPSAPDAEGWLAGRDALVGADEGAVWRGGASLLAAALTLLGATAAALWRVRGARR